MTQHEQEMKPNITVIGVGGAGGNAVNNMIASQLEGVDFVVANTDAQALEHSSCKSRIQLGHKLTAGLGAGSKAEIGAEAAEESEAEIKAAIQDANMVFITAGMGGGTGTGAAPVIARISRELGILTIGVVTKPFQFEGVHRMRSAEKGLEEMARHVDTLIIIPNQNLFRICDEKTTFKDAFKLADAVLNSGVRNVTDLVVMNGLINLDFADIRSVMAGMGKAMMGMGEGEGEGRAVQAAEAAISNPLLDDITMRGARGVLINITGGPDMTLFEVDEAANRIREEVDAEANIIFGSTFDDAMEGKLRVSVVATGFDSATIKPELQVAPAAGFDQAMIVEPSTAESVSSAGDDFGEFSGGSLNGEPADDQALNGHGTDADQDNDDSWGAWAPEKPSANPQPLPLRGASDEKPYKNGDARKDSASEFGSFVDGNTLRKLDPFGDDDWGKSHANGAAFFEKKPEKPRHTVTPMPPVSGGESRQKVVDEALVEDVTAWITRKYLGPKKAVSDKPVNGSANGSAAVLSQLNGHAAAADDLASTSEDSQAALDSGAEMTAGIAQPESEQDPESAAQFDLARDDDLGHEDNAVANGVPDSDPVPSFLQEGATIPVEASASIPASDEPSRSETDDDEDQNSGGPSGASETAKPAKGGAIRNLLRSLNPISSGTTNRRSIDTGRKVLDRLNRLHGYPDSEEGASHA